MNFLVKKNNFALQSFQTPAHNCPSSRPLYSRFPPPLPPIPHPLPLIPHTLSPYPRPPCPPPHLWKELETPRCRVFMGKLEARWVKLISEPALRSKNNSCFFLGLRESDLAICTCKQSEASEGNLCCLSGVTSLFE